MTGSSAFCASHSLDRKIPVLVLTVPIEAVRPSLCTVLSTADMAEAGALGKAHQPLWKKGLQTAKKMHFGGSFCG